MKPINAPTLHQQLDQALLDLTRLSGQLLNSSVQLSKRSHRGKPCKTCKRPLANKLAHQELIGEGDGPDLCWGYCSGEIDIAGQA